MRVASCLSAWCRTPSHKSHQRRGQATFVSSPLVDWMEWQGTPPIRSSFSHQDSSLKRPQLRQSMKSSSSSRESTKEMQASSASRWAKPKMELATTSISAATEIVFWKSNRRPTSPPRMSAWTHQLETCRQPVSWGKTPLQKCLKTNLRMSQRTH